MSAPEGHNSQESMLQGGEGVPIVPSQAGGGNSEESMLQGGEEVPIIPSQAGGDLKQALITKFDTLPQHIKDKINTYNFDDINGIVSVITIVQESTNINEDEKADLLYTTLYNIATDADIDKELQMTATNDDEKNFLELPNVKSLDKNKKFLALSYYRESKTLETRSNIKLDSTALKPIDTDTSIEFYDTNINNNVKHINFYMDKINFDASVDSTKLFKYINHRNNEWNYLYSNNPSSQRSTIKKPQINNNPRKIDEDITEFDQYGYCLPKPDVNPDANIESHVIMIPPINGNIQMFARVLNRLEKIGVISYNKDKYEFKIKNNMTIIFMPSFYNFNSVQEEYSNNIKLFNVFVDIWNSNINKIFILSVSNSNNYVVGTFLNKKLPTKNTENNWPLTMIEPSYIIYPYTHMNSKAFVVSEFNIKNVNFRSMVSICLNSKNTKSFGILVKKIKTSGVLDQDIKIITTLNPKMPDTKPGVLADLSYSNEKCNGLIESNTSLTDISNPFYIQKQNVDDKIGVDIIFVINLNNHQYTHKPLCLSSSEFNVDDDNLHIPNSEAVNSDNKEQIIIQDNIYSIRIPDKNNNVDEDWENKIFIKDEADFLNVTFLRPKILEAVFGTEWTLYLKDFLHTLTMSKCMKDTSLLTNNACYNCRKFLNKVERYLIQSNIKKDNMENKSNNRGFKEEIEPVENIQEDYIKEADTRYELKNRKQAFNTISSYDHTDTDEKNKISQEQRRAFIIAVNNKNKTYKFYIISVPKTANRSDDDKSLMIKLDELKNKHTNFTFVY
jgi:hypothetical protein